MTDARSRFLELAEARTEAILDKIRVFSNLANNGYPWETSEILAYLDRINAGLREARDRFSKNKQWIEDVDDPPIEEEEPTMELEAPKPRKLTFQDILKEVESEGYKLAEANEIIAMYRTTCKTPSTT